MSERPIAVGDLVMIVLPTLCCGGVGSLGHVFKVAAIHGGDSEPHRRRNCVGMKNTLSALDAADGKYADLRRLIRVDPEAELESTEETMKETA